MPASPIAPLLMPIPITGSHRLQPLQEAVAALGVQLSSEHWYARWQASMGHAVP